MSHLTTRTFAAVLLDNDGTLTDSRAAVERSWLAWAADHGVDPAVLVAASEALTGIRRAKTEAKASQKTPVAHATIAAPGEQAELLRLADRTAELEARIAEAEAAKLREQQAAEQAAAAERERLLAEQRARGTPAPVAAAPAPAPRPVTPPAAAVARPEVSANGIGTEVPPTWDNAGPQSLPESR